MDIETFRDNLARHGAGPYAWPEPEREAGRALFGNSPEAREAAAEMEALSALFDEIKTAPPAPAPDALLARVMADAADVQAARDAPAAPPRAEPSRMGWLAFLRPLFIGAAPAALGLWLGYAVLGGDVAEAMGAAELAQNDGDIVVLDDTDQDELLAFAWPAAQEIWE